MHLATSYHSADASAVSFEPQIAADLHTVRAAYGLVDQRYLTIGLQPPACGQQPQLLSAQSRVLIVRSKDGQIVATMTLTSAGFAPREAPHPLELEAMYRLETLAMPRGCVAEVRRVAALPHHRQAVLAMYMFARDVCLAAGIHSWLGLVEAGDTLDACAVLRALYRHHLTVHPLPLALHGDDALARALRDDVLPFGAEDAPVPAVPARLARFAADLGARLAGVPAVHPVYPRLVAPMLADLRNPVSGNQGEAK